MSQHCGSEGHPSSCLSYSVGDLCPFGFPLSSLSQPSEFLYFIFIAQYNNGDICVHSSVLQLSLGQKSVVGIIIGHLHDFRQGPPFGDL